MNVVAYTHVFDDPFLPYWIRHHVTVADKVVVWTDPECPDSTRAMIAAEQAQHGPERVQTRDLPFAGLDDLRFNNHYAWLIQKNKDGADWYYVLDTDEFVFSADCRASLAKYDLLKVGVVRPEKGWQMFHDTFPTTPGQVYDEVKKGVEEKGVTKPVIIRAGVVAGWSAGRHEAHALQAVWAPEFVMAHYRNMGLETQLRRNDLNWKRMTEDNRALGHGWQTAPEYTAKEPLVFEQRFMEAWAAAKVQLPGVGK
jgi:hypothetical protein